MGFFRNLFGKDEPFVPAATQSVPGLEPILVQVVEVLFPDGEDQKHVFDYIAKYKGKFKEGNSDDLTIMAVIASCDGNPKHLQDIDTGPWDQGRFWADIHIDYPQFHSMKSLHKWLRSKTTPQK